MVRPKPSRIRARSRPRRSRRSPGARARPPDEGRPRCAPAALPGEPDSRPRSARAGASPRFVRARTGRVRRSLAWATLADSSFQRRTLPAEVGDLGLLAAGRDRLVRAPGELLEPAVERRALRLGFVRESLHPLAQFELELRQALVERTDEFVALPFQPRGHLRKPLFDALRPGIRDLRESFGEDRLRLPREHVDGPVELAGEPARGVLARALHGCLELQRRGLGEAARCLVRLPFQGVQLPALDVGEPALDPFGDVELLAFDAFEQPPVPRLEALPHLLGGAPAFRRMGLELDPHRSGGSVGRLFELFPELRECSRLEVSDLVDLLAIGLDPRLRFGDEGLLALPELGELAGERLFRAFEVGRPARQPIRDALLRFREAGAELPDRLLFLLDDHTPALLRDPALLRLEARQRVGALARHQALDLGGPRGRLLLDQFAEIVASPVELGLDVGQALGALSPA